MKSNDDQGLMVLIGFKLLVMMTSLQNIVISGAQGFMILIGSIFLVKMIRLQSIVDFIFMFYSLVIFI